MKRGHVLMGKMISSLWNSFIHTTSGGGGGGSKTLSQLIQSASQTSQHVQNAGKQADHADNAGDYADAADGADGGNGTDCEFARRDTILAGIIKLIGNIVFNSLDSRLVNTARAFKDVCDASNTFNFGIICSELHSVGEVAREQRNNESPKPKSMFEE
eukprot:7402221-Pyramimonas_sp.AAC.1